MIINNMPDKVYYTLTIATYIFAITVACYVDNLTAIFNYIAAIAVSGIQFFFPAIAYILLDKHSVRSTRKLLWLSYLYLVLSVFVTVSILYATIKS